MGRTCRNICKRYQADPVPNKIRYEIGQKRCTFCGIFLSLDDVSDGNQYICITEMNVKTNKVEMKFYAR